VLCNHRSLRLWDSDQSTIGHLRRHEGN
jgi:hypothetical protein